MTAFTIADLASPDRGHADTALEDFTIFGYKTFAQGRAAEIHELITGAETVRTLDGASTLTITTDDTYRFLASIGLLSYRCVFTLDKYMYELAAVRKSGDTFTLTFEEVIVAEMRRSRDPRKIPPQTMSRVEFAYLLLSELPTVDFVTPPIDLAVTKLELARGKDVVRPGTDPEDTWKALTRIFSAVKWRFWVDGGKVFAAPDNYLISLPSAGTVSEHMGAVDDIDYDLDAGKPVQKMTINVVATRWSLPIGARIRNDDPGPQGGDWIVSEIRRSLFSPMTRVQCVKPVFPLPEPAEANDAGAGGTTTTELAASAAAGVAGSGVAPVTPVGTFQAYAAKQAKAKYGWGDDEFAALDAVWTPESRWDPEAQNPHSTAFGIAQFLDTTWAGTGIAKTHDGYKQVDAGLIYIKNRYGSPSNALAFRKIRGWY